VSSILILSTNTHAKRARISSEPFFLHWAALICGLSLLRPSPAAGYSYIKEDESFHLVTKLPA
jgi:hypothetical protein